jgi:hypothetical protein
MSKVPTLNLKAEDLADLVADYPEAEGLLRNLTRFATGTTAALSRGQTFAENIASQEASVTFDTDGSSAILNAPIKIALKLPAGKRAKHVLLTQAVSINTSNRQETAVALYGPGWATDGTSLLVSALGNLGASTHYRIGLLIIGG